MTIKATLQQVKQRIATLDAEVLLAHVLKQPRSYLYAHDEQALTNAQHEQLQALILRCEQGEPIAYITGKQEFWSLTFTVNCDVLIPRPETELMVELILDKLPNNEPHNIIDLGTGSGAIAIAIASERPNWQIIATDKSNAALVIAQQNAEKLKVTNIEFINSDWFAQVPKQLFSAILSNPPYIADDDPHLAQLNYEPQAALVAQNKGFADIEQLIKQAKKYLGPKGILMLEHGYQQDSAVQIAFISQNYNQVITYNDLANLPRVTIGQLS
jgi:release factor glutamine methyltransferase